MTAISWAPRATPLSPAAVLGRGPVRRPLAAALMERLAAGADLEIHAGPDVLLALGASTDLPWVDGATWLGRDGRLLVPTALDPGPDPDLVARAAFRTVGSPAAWIVLLPDSILSGTRAVGRPDVDVLRSIAADES